MTNGDFATGPYFLIAIFAIGVLSGGTAAVVGFGIGSLMTPLLLTRFTASLAIALVALPHLVATALRFVRHRAAIDRAVVWRFGVPSAIGGAVGGVLHGILRSETLIDVTRCCTAGYLGGLVDSEKVSAAEQVLNPNLIDPSRPRSDIQFLTVYVGAAASTWSDIARGKQKPTSGVGRLLGVTFNYTGNWFCRWYMEQQHRSSCNCICYRCGKWCCRRYIYC